MTRIAAAYNRVTGKSRTARTFLWQYFENPDRSESWILETDAGDLVGHHGIVSFKAAYQGNTYLIGKTENTFVVPEFRKSVYYPRYEAEIHKLIGPRYDLLFTTSPSVTRGSVGALRKRRGYVPVGQLRIVLLRFTMRFVLHRLRRKFPSRAMSPVVVAVSPLAAVASLAWKAILSARCRRDGISTTELPWTEETVAEVEAFCARNANASVLSAERNIRTYTWRLKDNPSSARQLFRQSSGDKVLGYLVVAKWAIGGALEGRVIEDIVSGSPRVCAQQLRAAARDLEGVDELHTVFLDSDPVLAEAVREFCGPFASWLTRRLDEMLALSSSRRLEVVPPVHYTPLLSEGVIDD